MRNFWRGTVSSVCLVVASGAYGLPPMGEQGNTAVELAPPAGVVSQIQEISHSMPAGTQTSTPLQVMAAHHDVVAGAATVSMARPHELVVTQTTDKAIVNWDQFNVGVGEHVRFNQPGPESVTLNRVTGNHGPSQILGSISANGKVFILNPSGVIIGKEAVIDAAGFVGSTLAMTNEDFLRGNYDLTPLEGNESTITNHGTIRVQAGGMALIASGQVLQDGWIQARVTTMEVEGHPTAVVDFDGDGLMSLRIPVGEGRRPEGTVLVRSGDVQKLLQQCLNTEHCRRASHAEVKGGVVVISGGMAVNPGAVSIQGEQVVLTDATATASQGAQGGSISVHGAKGVVSQNSILDGSGEHHGGAVRVTGADVQLKQTTLQANGAQGGGTITVGGSRGDTEPKNVVADKETVLSANAQSQGDGGSIMVWSDENTRFEGRVEATGGAESGNGGKAEVSGKMWLGTQGMTADLSAPKGQVGHLIFDPKTIVVQTGGATIYPTGSTFPLPDSGDTSTFDATQVAGFGPNTLLQANDTLTISVPFSPTNGLTLQAGRTVAIGGAVTVGAGNLDITANDWLTDDGPPDYADKTNRDDGAGNITLGADINVPGGTISMTILDSDDGAATPGAITASTPVSVSSSGAQTYSGSMNFSKAVTFTTVTALSSDDISISGGTITGEGSLTLAAGLAGTVTLGNSIDTGSALTVTGRTIGLMTDSISTTGDQTYNGPLQVLEATTLESSGALIFSDPITGSYALTLSSNSATPMTPPSSMNLDLGGTDYALYFGGSAGGSFEEVTLNGIGGASAAQYATLLAGTTGLYYVNGVLITLGGGGSTTTAMDPLVNQVAVGLSQFINGSEEETLETLGHPLDAHSDLIQLKRLPAKRTPRVRQSLSKISVR